LFVVQFNYSIMEFKNRLPWQPNDKNRHIYSILFLSKERLMILLMNRNSVNVIDERRGRTI